MLKLSPCIAVAMLVAVPACIQAQASDPLATIQQQLEKQIVRAKLAGNGDILTAGSVMVLQKDGLVMCGTTSPANLEDTYKNGKLSAGLFGWGLLLGIDHVDSNTIPQRKFVTGEKFWVIDFRVMKDGVRFLFRTDPDANGIRYAAQLKIPFAKNVVPPTDDVMRTIAEVVTVDAPVQSAAAAPAVEQPPSPPPQPMAAITPPPPPADTPPPAPVAPKTIALGQTKDEVMANFGQPQKVVSLPTKEIDYYPDMKVTFVKGKVADVQ